MRSPFSPHYQRFKWYVVGSAFIATLCFKCTTSSITFDIIDDANDHFQSKALFAVLFLSVYIMFSMFSVAYAYRINTRPGMSSDIRRAFVRGHLEYVLCYILTWLPYLGLNYFILYSTSRLGTNITRNTIQDHPHYTDELHRWEGAYMFSSMLTGLMMSIVRIREPLFWSSAKVYINQFFGETDVSLSKSRKGMDGTTLSFLMSSLNIELVHIILTAVSSHTVGTSKSKDNYKVY